MLAETSSRCSIVARGSRSPPTRRRLKSPSKRATAITRTRWWNGSRERDFLRKSCKLLHLDEADRIRETVRQHEIAVARHVHVAHDVAAARNGPSLELLAGGIE